jgi:serine acetyltransferase
MKHIPLIVVLGAVLVGGCAVRTSERVVERPVPAQTVVTAEPAVVAPATTTTVYTTR